MKQECIPVECLPPTLYPTGGLCPEVSVRETPWTEIPPDTDSRQTPFRTENPPWTETPVDRDLAETPHIEIPRQRPSGQRSLDRDPLTETPLDRDPAAQIPPWTDTPGQKPLDRYPPSGQRTPLPNRITDRCKNITFPQLRLWVVIIMGTNL